MKRFLLPVSALLLASCAVSASAELQKAPKVGTLVGHVDVGPLIPSHRGHNPNISPEVFKKYTVKVTQHGPQNGQARSMLIRVVAHSKLSATGDFRIILPAGKFQVGINSMVQLLKNPVQQDVTISAGKITRVTIHVDTSRK